MTEIFYVEDDSNISQMVKDYLEQRDYRVYLYGTATSVKEALKRHVPQLVLLDWNMPDGSGDDFADGYALSGPKCRLFF